MFHKVFGIYNWFYKKNTEFNWQQLVVSKLPEFAGNNWYYPKERNLQDDIGVIEIRKFTRDSLCCQNGRNLQYLFCVIKSTGIYRTILALSKYRNDRNLEDTFCVIKVTEFSVSFIERTSFSYAINPWKGLEYIQYYCF